MDGPWINLVTALVVTGDTLMFKDDSGLSIAAPDIPDCSM